MRDILAFAETRTMQLPTTFVVSAFLPTVLYNTTYNTPGPVRLYVHTLTSLLLYAASDA
jgi:hypothetical protein